MSRMLSYPLYITTMPMMTRTQSGAKKRVDYALLAKPPRAKTQRSRKPRPTKALTAAIKSVVQKQAEVKNVMRVLDNYVLYNGTIGTPDWVYPLPDVLPGTGETQRIGDRVKPKSLTVKLHVAFNSTIGGFQTIIGRIYVVKHKKFTSQAQLALNMPVDGQKLLLDGNGAVQPYDGTIENAQFGLNTDLWTNIRTVNFTLSKDNTAPVQGSAYRAFTIRIPCPQTLVYTDSTQTLPENFCPAMAIGFTSINGTTFDDNNTPVMAFAQSFFTYTDE